MGRTREGPYYPPPSQQSRDAGVCQPVPRQTQPLSAQVHSSRAVPMAPALTFERERQFLPRILVLLAVFQQKVREKAWQVEQELKDFRVTSDIQNCHNGLRQRLSSGPALGTKIKNLDLRVQLGGNAQGAGDENHRRSAIDSNIRPYRHWSQHPSTHRPSFPNSPPLRPLTTQVF